MTLLSPPGITFGVVGNPICNHYYVSQLAVTFASYLGCYLLGWVLDRQPVADVLLPAEAINNLPRDAPKQTQADWLMLSADYLD